LGRFGDFGKNCHFGHFGQPFPNQGGRAEKKYHSESGKINETEPHAVLSELDPTRSQAKFSTGEVKHSK
jgi:hypothetical protein